MVQMRCGEANPYSGTLHVLGDSFTARLVVPGPEFARSYLRDGGDDGSNGEDDTHCDEDRPEEPPARPGLRVFVEVFLHRGERIEPRDARIPPPVVPDVDPGHSPRRDELKHAEPDAGEAEDQASDQFDHNYTISTPDSSTTVLLPEFRWTSLRMMRWSSLSTTLRVSFVRLRTLLSQCRNANQRRKALRATCNMPATRVGNASTDAGRGSLGIFGLSRHRPATGGVLAHLSIVGEKPYNQ
jgi:hypothetical protein